jgi:hypothetical protein
VRDDPRVPRVTREATVAVVGLGDLGERVVDSVARLPLGRVAAIGRSHERADRVAYQAALVAGILGGADRVEPFRADVGDVEATAALLGGLAPQVIVMAASRHTWWRTPPGLRPIPYGLWLPLHLGLVRDLVRARDEAGLSAPVVALPAPDAVGPALRTIGCAPELGAGNVAEVAVKLRRLAAVEEHVAPELVSVRLVAHHAVERYAFDAFRTLGGPEGGLAGGPPPFRAHVEVEGRVLPDERVRALLRSRYPLLEGRGSHAMTAAATAATVAALLDDVPQHIHVPAPGGRPGGYPVRASAAGVELDLPDGTSESDAVAINTTAARWDGIERIEEDGEVVFTREAANEVERLLGWRLERFVVGEADAVAAEMERRRDEVT